MTVRVIFMCGPAGSGKSTVARQYRATVLARVSGRAARDGDDFRLSPELAAFYFDHFEVPTAAEGPLTVISGG